MGESRRCFRFGDAGGQFKLRWVAWLFFGLMMPLSRSAWAGSPPFTVELPQKEFTLTLNGSIENGKSIDLAANLRVRLKGVAGKTAFIKANFSDVLPQPMRDWPNVQVIPASRLTLDEKQLTVDHAMDLTVMLKNQTMAGTYAGTVELSVADQPEPRILVPILVVVQEVPSFQLINKPDPALLSNCRTLCALTDWLMPGSLRDELHVTVLNKSLFPIRMMATGIWRAKQFGDSSAPIKGPTQSVTVFARKDGKDVPVEGADIEPLTPLDFVIRLDREKLPADHYKVDAQWRALAASQVAVPPQSRPAVRPANTAFDVLPLSVDIRDGALIPVILVFAGVVLGRIFGLLRSTSMAARLALFKQTENLRHQIQDIQDVSVQVELEKEIESNWASFGTGALTLQAFQDSLSDIAKKIAVFIKDQQMRAEAPQLPAAAANSITAQLDESKALLMQPGIKPGALSNFDIAVKSYMGAKNMAAPADGIYSEVQHQRLVAARSRFTRRIGVFFGIDTLQQTAFMYKYVRPSFYLLIIFAVGLSGAMSQYAADGHSTFGASVLDYLTVGLWGFGSQVLAATFSDIQSLK